MTVFSGLREDGLAHVFHNDQPFSMARSLRWRKHSPTGFEWGYAGSGPAQLALAILLEITSEQAALLLYQDFKRDVITGLADEWMLTEPEIQEWLDAKSTT